MIKILKENKYLILLFIILSLQVSSFSIYSVSHFEALNIPIYDGVMYDYQQIRRYENFNNDFSFINRFSQAIYEFKGNAISGLYSAIITFFTPSFLISKWDIFIRSFIGVFIFSISYYLFFKKYFFKKWIIISLCIFFQLPFFYHFRTGLGSSIPELVSAIYLLSGFMFILSGIDKIKVSYITIGIIVMFLSVLFRFNFFVYLVLISTPLLFVLIYKWRRFSLIQRKRLVIILVLFSIIFSGYISIYFSSFINYYTKGAYAFTTISISVSFMLEVFKEYFGITGILIFAVIIFGNSINLKEKPFYFKLISTNILLVIPFFVFFSFIVLYLKSTNVPHIMSIMALFLSIFVISLKINFFLKKVNIKIVQICLSIFLIIFIYINFHKIHQLSITNQYLTQHKVVSFLDGKLMKNPSIKFRCFYDSAIEIPIIVALYNKQNKLYKLDGGFNVQDVFYPKSVKEHTNEIISTLSSVDFVIINSAQSKGIQIGEKALKIQLNLRKYLYNNSKFKIVKTIPSTFYSNLLVFQKLQN